MSDPLAPLVPGEYSPFVNRAGTINAVLEAARRVKRGERGTGGGSPELDPAPASLRVYIRNDTGGALAEFSVVALGEPLISAVTAPLNLQSQPAFPGTAPASAADAFAILTEPATASGSGNIVQAIVSGVAVCDLIVNDAAHGYASPKAGTTSPLESTATGPAKIVWKSGASGTVRAVVLLHGDDGVQALTVEEEDGSPSLPFTYTLQFDQAAGFVVTQPAANTALVSLDAETVTDTIIPYIIGDAPDNYGLTTYTSDGRTVIGVSPGSGLTIDDAGDLVVDPEEDATTEYTTDKVTGFALVCGALRLSVERRTVTLSRNAAGVVIGPTVSDPVEHTFDVDACDIAACCEADPLEVAVATDPATTGVPIDGASGEGPLDVEFTITPTGGVGPFSGTIDYGDGATDTFGPGAGPFVKSHTYTDPDFYVATITTTDATCGCVVTTYVPVLVTSGECVCAENCPDGIGAAFDLTLTGGTGDYAALNGPWKLFLGDSDEDFCYYYWCNSAGWTGTAKVGSDKKATFRFQNIDNSKHLTYTPTSARTTCCEDQPDVGTGTGAGTGTAPTFVDDEATQPTTPCPACPPAINCSGTETSAPASLTLAFAGCTGPFAALNGQDATAVYSAGGWDFGDFGGFFTSNVVMTLVNPGDGSSNPTFQVLFQKNDVDCPLDFPNGVSPSSCTTFLITSTGNNFCLGNSGIFCDADCGDLSYTVS